jgi:hypothetical protein
MRQNKLLILILLLLMLAGFLQGVEYPKKPQLAMLYSALLPGGGQLYNEAYVKSFVVVGLQAWLISSAIDDGKSIRHYNKLMSAATEPEFQQYYQAQRNSYRDELKSDYWWIGTVAILSVADAFVDAHLYSYKAEKNKVDLKFKDKMLNLQYHF